MSMMAEPSSEGRFGDFGGRFVPETLVPACEELEAAFRSAWADAAFRAELDDLLRDYAGRPAPLTECHRLGETSACVSCSSGRTSTTPAPTRSTTCSARPCSPGGWASAGWWPRPAPASTAWPPPRPPRCFGMECKVYMGAGRRRAAGAQRVPHAPARRRGRGGPQRQPHPEGRGQRGHAGLGGHRRDHPLLPRLGDGPASVPVDGARAPPGDRRRGPRAVPGPPRRRSRRGGGLRRRRVQRRRHLLRLRRHRRRSWSASSRRAARPSAAACRAWCTA